MIPLFQLFKQFSMFWIRPAPLIISLSILVKLLRGSLNASISSSPLRASLEKPPSFGSSVSNANGYKFCAPDGRDLAGLLIIFDVVIKLNL